MDETILFGFFFTKSLNSFYNNTETYIYHKSLLETDIYKHSGSGGLSLIEERKQNFFALAGIRYMITNRIGLNLFGAYSLEPYSTTDLNGLTKKSNVFKFVADISFSFGRHKTWEEKDVNWKLKNHK